MFVRTKFDRDRNRTRVQIVQSVRHGQRVSQKVVRHVGIARSDTETEALKQLAVLILEEIRHTQAPQRTLFTAREYADLITLGRHTPRPERLGVDVGQCREKARLSLGVREAFGEVYDALGFDRVLGARRRSSGRIVRELTLARLSQPRSKRATVMDLSGDAGVTLNLDRVYQSLDLLDEGRVEALQRLSGEAAQKLFPEPLDVLFYDCTTLYFESDGERSPEQESCDALRSKGYSKDGKPQRCQVVLALWVTADGLPVGYELFPGNTFEGHTLTVALGALRQRHSLGQVTVVADAAMLSQANQEALKARGLAFILGYRHKSAPAAVKRQILAAQGYVPWDEPDAARDRADKTQAGRYKVIEHAGARIIATWSQKRARKDAHNREQALQRLSKQLARSTKPAGVARRGYARFLDFPEGGRVSVNQDKIAEAARWDGLRCIIAHGNAHLGPRELLSQYRQLWEIEHCFRTNKHDLRIRPIYHWSARRIRAHIAICYMAFCCLQHLRHRLRRLGYPMSPETIRRELARLQLSILAKQGTEDEYALPSPATADSQRIYRCLGLRWNEAPFKLAGSDTPQQAAIG